MAAGFSRCLWNLLHNAVKFTRPGGRVDVSLSSTDEYVRVLVKDTGQGIAAEFLPYIFDRFRQADPSTTREAWGLGIGLSIVKHLVELHGGLIEASSPGTDRGATFVIELPVIHRAEAVKLAPNSVPRDAVVEPSPSFDRSGSVIS